MQPRTSSRHPRHRRGADRINDGATALLVLTLALASGCRDAAGPSAPSTGSIQVSLATTGADLDGDGYAVAVDDLGVWSVGVNETLTIPSVRSGTHMVRLQGVALNCGAAQGTDRSVLVEGGRQSVTAFAVSCDKWPSPAPLTPLQLAETELLFVRRPQPSLDSRSGDIYRMRVDGTGLTKVAENAFSPSWSPEGSRVAFGRSTPLGWNLCIAQSDGSDVRCKAQHWYPLASAASWSPDGRKLVFSDFDRIYVLDTFTMANDYELAIPGVNSVAWSPTGHRIAFAGVILGIMNPDGSGKNILSYDPAGKYAVREVAWSPDGQKLGVVLIPRQFDCNFAFCEMSVATQDLDVSTGDAAGSGLRVLAVTDGGEDYWLEYLSWAPDATHMIFGRKENCSSGDPQPGGTWRCRTELVVINAGNGSVALVVPNYEQPSWGR